MSPTKSSLMHSPSGVQLSRVQGSSSKHSLGQSIAPPAPELPDEPPRLPPPPVLPPAPASPLSVWSSSKSRIHTHDASAGATKSGAKRSRRERLKINACLRARTPRAEPHAQARPTRGGRVRRRREPEHEPETSAN